MDKYINADKLMEIIKTHHYMLANAINSRDYGMFTTGIEQAVSETESVEIVRCKDCKYCTEQGDWCQNEKVQSMCFTDGEVEYYFGDKRGHLYPDMDFFCKYGERKETE